MDIRSDREVRVTISFNEREAKLLTCLVGAISPSDAEEIIQTGLYFKEWIGKLDKREVSDFTGILFESLSELLF